VHPLPTPVPTLHLPQPVGRFFQLRQRGSTLWAEMRGGAVTFLVICYILAGGWAGGWVDGAVTFLVICYILAGGWRCAPAVWIGWARWPVGGVERREALACCPDVSHACAVAH